MAAIHGYERGLIGPVLDGLASVPGLRLYGITDRARTGERVPTFAFSLEGHHPRAVAEQLGARGISAWDGDYYAFELMRRLGLDDSGGLVRIGLVHYNTLDEVDRLIEALRDIA
jgi:selenocysteine lyase/cysteine desulfurase